MNTQYSHRSAHYTLYKNPIQLETLHIVQYLHHHNIHLLPNIIIERNHPAFITELPTVVADNNRIYSGLSEVITFYETTSGIHDILNKANEFKLAHPKYTIQK